MTFPPDHVDFLWQRVPAHLHEGLNDYLMGHHRPGDFLCAVLRNDLIAAVSRADDVSKPALPDIVAYLLACAPSPSFGSEKNFKEWLKEREVGFEPDQPE